MAEGRLSNEDIKKLRAARWKCRTDLLFLCNEILGYKDVFKDVHGPLIDTLQKFPVPKDQSEYFDHDQFDSARQAWSYKPLLKMQQLPGKRRRLILDARGHLKTTINVQAHTIQWILNYPDITIAIFQSNLEKGQAILGEIKHHFQYNPKLRALFPELCPQKSVDNFGTMSEFTTPGRSPFAINREPTLMALSIDKGTAGYHFHVMKFSDIVEPENSKTGERCQAVIDAFTMAENLLVSPVYWIDVEGTRYSFADLYGVLIKQYNADKAAGIEPRYQVYTRGCFKKKTPDGKPQKFVPEELDPDKYPYLLDERGKRIPWWAKDADGSPRFPLEHFETLEKQNSYQFSCQQLNFPEGGVDGKKIFPINLFSYLPRDKFEKLIRISYYELVIDTAETTGPRSDYSALTIGGFDAGGCAWIRYIRHGKFTSSEIIEHMFDLYKRFKPTVVKIEETGFVRGMKAMIQREMEMRGVFLPLEFIKRDTQLAKTERIERTLEPWYKKGLIKFVSPKHSDPTVKMTPDDEKYWAALQYLQEEELKTFPLGSTDDILDTIADLFQGKDLFGRNAARPQADQTSMYEDKVWNDFLGISDPFSDEYE